MARRDADAGLTAPQIQAQLSVPPRVAQAAAANPIPSTDDRRGCADAMYDSVYGTHAAARNATLGDLRSKGASLASANQALDQAKAARDALVAAPGTTAQALAGANNLVNARYATAMAHTTRSRPRMPPTAHCPRRRMRGTPVLAQRPR